MNCPEVCSDLEGAVHNSAFCSPDGICCTVEHDGRSLSSCNLAESSPNFSQIGASSFPTALASTEVSSQAEKA